MAGTNEEARVHVDDGDGDWLDIDKHMADLFGADWGTLAAASVVAPAAALASASATASAPAPAVAPAAAPAAASAPSRAAASAPAPAAAPPQHSLVLQRVEVAANRMTASMYPSAACDTDLMWGPHAICGCARCASGVCLACTSHLQTLITQCRDARKCKAETTAFVKRLREWCVPAAEKLLLSTGKDVDTFFDAHKSLPLGDYRGDKGSRPEWDKLIDGMDAAALRDTMANGVVVWVLGWWMKLHGICCTYIIHLYTYITGVCVYMCICTYIYMCVYK